MRCSGINATAAAGPVHRSPAWHARSRRGLPRIARGPLTAAPSASATAATSVAPPGYPTTPSRLPPPGSTTRAPVTRPTSQRRLRPRLVRHPGIGRCCAVARQGGLRCARRLRALAPGSAGPARRSVVQRSRRHARKRRRAPRVWKCRLRRSAESKRCTSVTAPVCASATDDNPNSRFARRL